MFMMIGGSGNFQKLMLAISIITQFCCAGPINLMSYGAPGPISECRSSLDPTKFEVCSEKQACVLLESGNGIIRFDSDNWTKNYHMYCENATQRELAKSLFVFFCMIGSTIGLLAADYFGRISAFYTSALIVVGGSLMIPLADNYLLKLMLTALSASGTIIYSSLFTIALSEWIRKLSINHSNI